METILEVVQQYYVPTIFGICLLLGYIIKHSLDFINNKHIPLILGIIGVLINVWLHMDFNPDILLGGLASGLGAVGIYEAYKNGKDDE